MEKEYQICERPDRPLSETVSEISRKLEETVSELIKTMQGSGLKGGRQ